MKLAVRYFVAAWLVANASQAVCQEALKTWLHNQKIVNVPTDIQEEVVPGGFVLVAAVDGSTKFAPPSDKVVVFTKQALAVSSLPTVTISGVDDAFNKDRNVGAGFLGLDVGFNTSSGSTQKSDQAVLYVADLTKNPQDIDDFIYNDPYTEKVYEFWNPPTEKLRTGDVYFVEKVYYAKELTITESSKKGINGALGSNLQKCTSGTGSDSKGKTDTTGKTDKTGTTGTTGSTGASSAASGGNLFTQFIKNLVSNKINVGGGSCVDDNDTAHLKSEIPVPIGMKLDLVGYFKKHAEKLDYNAANPIL